MARASSAALKNPPQFAHRMAITLYGTPATPRTPPIASDSEDLAGVLTTWPGPRLTCMSSRFLLLALATTGCSISPAQADWESPPPGVTPYRCDAIVPSHQAPTSDPAVVAPWRALAREDDLADAIWIGRVKQTANKHELLVLTVEERVRLQHQLVRVAERLDRLRRFGDNRPAADDVHHAILTLIRSTAPTTEQLATLGASDHPAVNAILGPASGIVERATKTCAGGNSIHVVYNRGTLAFRPLRSGAKRALVAQLVAFDPEGHPHVTPLVDGIELRLGDEVSSPACVVQAGDDGVLRSAPHAAIEEHKPFVIKNGDGVACVRCHRDSNTMRARDLAADEVPEIDAARDGQVERLAAELWKGLSEELPAVSPAV